MPEAEGSVLDEGVLLRALINMTENIPYQVINI